MTPEVKDIKTPSLEFEDNWSKPTETKAPIKPVDIPVPGKEKEKPVDQTPTETSVAAETTSAVDKPGNLSASLSGEFTTDGINFIQSLVFKLVNKRKIVRRIGKENIERFGDLLEELLTDKKKPALEPKDLRLFLQFKRLMQVQEDIPFTDEEYDKDIECLAESITRKQAKDCRPGSG